MSNSDEKKVTENGSRISGHSYDGIEELDNSLPNWWINLFYLTILFSAGYFAHYILGEGPTLVKEYELQKNQAELLALSQSKPDQVATEDELRALLKQPSQLQAGKAIFQVKCVSCHGVHAEGGIGPNLTDDYWIHGGKLVDIVRIITQGVPDKGMPPWGPLLKQTEIHSLSAYVKSLRGSHPPNPKPPQGELLKE